MARALSAGQPIHLGSINQGRQDQPCTLFYTQHNDRLSSSNGFVLDGSVCFLPMVRCKFQWGSASEKAYFCPLVFGSFEFPLHLKYPYLIKTQGWQSCVWLRMPCRMASWVEQRLGFDARNPKSFSKCVFFYPVSHRFNFFLYSILDYYMDPVSLFLALNPLSTTGFKDWIWLGNSFFLMLTALFRTF